ncbi:hypothetical protein Dimus_016530 [Dionaea muscipula]
MASIALNVAQEALKMVLAMAVDEIKLTLAFKDDFDKLKGKLKTLSRVSPLDNSRSSRIDSNMIQFRLTFPLNYGFVLIMQEEVLERAKRAKEKAAREAIEEQGFIPSPAVTNYSSQVKSSDTSRSSSSSAHDAATATPTVSSSSTAVNIDGRPTFNTDQDNADQDPLSGLSTDRLM